jgi:hypothetical protein
MKATFPVTTKSSEKLIEYIRKEMTKKNHDGFDAKNVGGFEYCSEMRKQIFF